ncbi:MAG TPA: S1/P1 nuclease [Pyrinomonadaceae bacterium]|nr:S1/P1 nuclease [Pyrinomonadaceae bacterium]
MEKHLKLIARGSLALCLVLGIPARAAAWGSEGHRLVARIAHWRLEQLRDKKNDAKARRALEAIGQLLAANVNVPELPKPRLFEQAAQWPDWVREDYPAYDYADNLHFVSIPLDKSDPAPDRFVRAEHCKPRTDVPGGLGADCVVGALEHFQGVLKNPQSGQRARLEALGFIAHFMGDLHQPLHTSEDYTFRNDAGYNNGVGDKGANYRYVFYYNYNLFNSPDPESCYQDWKVCTDYNGDSHKKLHAVWDKHLILTEMANDDEKADLNLYFAALVGALPGNDPGHQTFAALEAGSVVSWAEDSHHLAKQSAYNMAGPRPKKSPADNRVHDFYYVGSSYQRRNIKIIEDQLRKGGIRLAAFLRESF